MHVFVLEWERSHKKGICISGIEVDSVILRLNLLIVVACDHHAQKGMCEHGWG